MLSPLAKRFPRELKNNLGKIPGHFCHDGYGYWLDQRFSCRCKLN